jgi:hypothetical protein
MFMAEGSIRADGRAVVEVRRVRGLADLIAWVIREEGCRHGARREGFCWVAPPRWMWWLGAPDHIWSLGGVIYTWGQWAHRRAYASAVHWSHEIDREDLMAVFGWDRVPDES